MTTKEEKLYTFYKQCKENNYIDMSDETQALKAKVFAMDLKLRYSDISKLYNEACEVYKVVEERNRIESEEAAKEAIRTSVSGELIVTLRYDLKNNDYIEVYRRPDRSIYCTHNGIETKYEGAPDILVNKGGVLSYEYHPSKTVFTGASSGGIAMGGFHQTEAYTTEKVSKTGKGDIHAKSGNMEIWVKYIVFSDATDYAFRRDETYISLSHGKRIVCIDESNIKFSRDIMSMTMKSGAGYQDALSKASMASDMIKLPMSTIQKIAELLNAVIAGNYPETDEECYKKAISLSASTKSDDLLNAVNIFKKISDYKDSSLKASCIQKKYEEILQKEKETIIINKEIAQKKRKKILMFAIPIFVLIAIAIFSGRYLRNLNIYNNAIQAEHQQNYEQAKLLYEEIPNFKDASTKAEVCEVELQNVKKKALYDEAISKMNKGEYNAAIRIFTDLGSFEDSTEMLKQAELLSTYNEGIKLLNEGNYADAQIIFENLGSFQDSIKKADEAKQLYYNNIRTTEVIELMEEERYGEAARLLKVLSDDNYKDSKKLYVLCSILGRQTRYLTEDTVLEVSDNEILKDDAITNLVNDNEDACSELLPRKTESFGIVLSSWVAKDDQLIVNEPTLINSAEKSVMVTVKRYEISKFGNVEELGKTFYTAKLVYEQFGSEDAKTPNTYYAFGIDN